jgi:demethylspheroidene O-methyltransferase
MMAGSEEMQGASALADRWRGIRDFLLSSSRFQRIAAAFPLTRPIARRHAADLFDLCAGFVYTQVLFACVGLRLLPQLQGGPQSVPTLAARASVPIDAMNTLLEAAASLRLLERRSGERYGLGPLGAAVLGNPGIAAMVEHHALLYADLVNPIALLRGQGGERKLSRYWPYAGNASPSGLTREIVSPYTALMSASQPMVAEMVLAAYPFARHRRLLDVGGGDGSFLIAVGQRVPRLELCLFELPAVAGMARDKFAAHGLSNRASVSEGNFLKDPLPKGSDVVSLIRVLHDHDDDAVLSLLARAREMLPSDGVLVIGEPMAKASGADAINAYFKLYLYAMGSGRPRSFAALRKLLNQSGFGDVRRRATRIPMIAGVIVARPRPEAQL